jgi:hypothetical protein
MSQCRDNAWQPTFVHDIDRPEPNGAPFYVAWRAQKADF